MRKQKIKQIQIDIDNIISQRMMEFANTPLDKRPNGWEELVEIKKRIDKFLENEKAIKNI